MYDYSKLKGRIVEKFGTIAEFSTHLSISKVSLSMKLNNKIEISRKDIMEWSKLLDIVPEEYGYFYFNQKLNEI
jgi:hypothetical protein